MDKHHQLQSGVYRSSLKWIPVTFSNMQPCRKQLCFGAPRISAMVRGMNPRGHMLACVSWLHFRVPLQVLALGHRLKISTLLQCQYELRPSVLVSVSLHASWVKKGVILQAVPQFIFFSGSLLIHKLISINEDLGLLVWVYRACWTGNTQVPVFLLVNFVHCFIRCNKPVTTHIAGYFLSLVVTRQWFSDLWIMDITLTSKSDGCYQPLECSGNVESMGCRWHISHLHYGNDTITDKRSYKTILHNGEESHSGNKNCKKHSFPI